MIKTYACINMNESVRMRSSSGGVFYELAKFTIESNGVVFGARFNDDWDVVHGFCETMEEIGYFMGSKYSQSKMGNSYQMVKSFLKDGRTVLFSGTPCQVNGLQAFLKRKYDNLILVDFICHGVPSPKVWNDYLKTMKKERVQTINFRDKNEGWIDYSLSIEYLDGSHYTSQFQKNIYMKGFLRDIYLRPSCYNCKFKGMNRVADFTLADFWGVNKVSPDMYDNKGTSLVLLNSSKAVDVFDNVASVFKIKEIDLNEIIKYNSAYINSAPMPKERLLFFHEKNEDIVNTIEKYTKDKKIKILKNMLKRQLKKTIKYVTRR